MENNSVVRPAQAFAAVGGKVLGIWSGLLKSAFEETGFAMSVLASSVLHLHAAFRKRREIISQIVLCGFNGLPVAVIVAFFSGLVLSLQVGKELLRFGQQSSIGALVSIAMCREMGPVMTGNILAGLIGSKMAAEIGTMKVSQEIDALEVMSIDPVRFLVMPRVLAMCIVCPILTMYANMVGIIGGWLVADGILNVGWSTYFKEINLFLEFKDIAVGILKALIFGMTIAVVGCTQGMRAEHGAYGVGRVTMRAVVIASVFILVFDWFIGWFLF
jgi:phospholipid/cholesterol/gamma-HCH transport system permease protein